MIAGTLNGKMWALKLQLAQLRHEVSQAKQEASKDTQRVVPYRKEFLASLMKTDAKLLKAIAELEDDRPSGEP